MATSSNLRDFLGSEELHRAVAIACTLLAACASGGGAQDTAVVRLIGEVRDYATDAPIQGIAVRIRELALVRLTDPNGFFSFDSIPEGQWTFEASGLGYETNVEASTIGENYALLIRLEPKPVEVEGLYVSVVQRLVRRRLAAPSRIYAWDKSALDAAMAPDIGSFVRTRGVAVWVRCGGEWSDPDLPNCYLLKGRPTRVTIFVDDIQLLRDEGTGRLWSYDPRDLWTVEFLPECGQLRIYTEHFMRLVEEGQVRLAPTICSY